MNTFRQQRQSGEVAVRFEPAGLLTLVPSGTTIAEAAADLGIPIRLDCGGNGLCGRCRVIAGPVSVLSPLSEYETDVLSPAEIVQSFRLACVAKMEGDVVVTIPSQVIDRWETVDKGLVESRYPVDPVIERIVLPKGGPLKDAAAVKDWLTERARSVTGRHIRLDDLQALRQLSEVGIDGRVITVVHHQERGVTAVLSGIKKQSRGVAIDIGTTTLASYLCDLETGKVLATAASLNPQRRYGEDVISRIAFASQYAHGLQTLNQLIVDAIDRLIERCLLQTNGDIEDIDELTIVGNTLMETILAGFHPRSLGVSPYLPLVRSAWSLPAREVGLKLNPGTNVFLFPVISGFVGGDTVSAIIADAMLESDEMCLLVDIGTNGELVLGNRDGLWATSCATGPALEGAQISCGMRAVSGAIHMVDMDSETFQPRYRVIGEDYDILPLGICGSGIVDAVAAMRRVGILLPNGRIKEGMPGVVSDDRGVGREFVLVPAEKSGTGKPITLTLADIRQFQVAKSALATGIELLMHHAGVSRIDRTVLTGSFGARFNWKNALDTGMLPKSVLGGKVLSRENLAGVGGVMALLNRRYRQQTTIVAQRVRFIELARDPQFAARFAQGMGFPPLESS